MFEASDNAAMNVLAERCAEICRHTCRRVPTRHFITDSLSTEHFTGNAHFDSRFHLPHPPASTHSGLAGMEVRDTIAFFIYFGKSEKTGEM